MMEEDMDEDMEEDFPESCDIVHVFTSPAAAVAAMKKTPALDSVVLLFGRSSQAKALVAEYVGRNIKKEDREAVLTDGRQMRDRRDGEDVLDEVLLAELSKLEHTRGYVAVDHMGRMEAKEATAGKLTFGERSAMSRPRTAAMVTAAAVTVDGKLEEGLLATTANVVNADVPTDATRSAQFVTAIDEGID